MWGIVLLREGVYDYPIRRAFRVCLCGLVQRIFGLAVSCDAIWRYVSTGSFHFLGRLLRYVRRAIRLMRAFAVCDATSFRAVLGALWGKVGHCLVAIVCTRCKVVRLVRVVGLVLASAFASCAWYFLVDVAHGAA